MAEAIQVEPFKASKFGCRALQEVKHAADVLVFSGTLGEVHVGRVRGAARGVSLSTRIIAREQRVSLVLRKELQLSQAMGKAQRWIVPSKPPVASAWPSGANASARTPACLNRVERISSVATSQKLITP